MPVAPAFGRRITEGMMIGRMLLNYGELELLTGMILGNVLADQDTALRVLFRIVGESARIGAADALARNALVVAGLEAEYADGYGALRWCVQTRNRYAHCHWADDPRCEGLFFTELGEPAKAGVGLDYWFRHVDIPLLSDQLAHFEYAGDCLTYVNFEYLRRARNGPDHSAPMPPKRPQPNPHNPPALHIPPWLTEAEKLRHIERTRVEEAADHSPPAEPRSRKPSSSERREAAMKARDLRQQGAAPPGERA